MSAPVLSRIFLTDPSVHQLGCSLHDRESTRIPIHQACTKVIHMEFRANIGVGFCRRVALCILRAHIQRSESQMEWHVTMLKAVCQCSSRYVSDSIVRVPVCVRAQLRQTRCSDGSFWAQILTLFSTSSRVQVFCTRQ